jgi:O-antigen ligase
MMDFSRMLGIKTFNWLDELKGRIRHRMLDSGLAVLIGIITAAIILGLLQFRVPVLYVFLGIGGILFVFLLAYRIEVAIILAILLRIELSRFNYLGEDYAFHPNGFIGVAIFGAAVVFFAINKVDLSRLRAYGAFSGFFLMAVLSQVFSGEYLMDGLIVTFRLGAALAIYLVLLYKLDSIKKVMWVVMAVVLSQIFPTISGLLSRSWGSKFLQYGEDTVRLGHSGFGAMMAMILILCLAFFLNAETKSSRILWGSLTALFLLGLFFSFGRAGWIGFLAGVTVIGVMRHKKILFFLPAILIVIVLIIPAIPQRFSDIHLNRLEDRSSSTFAGRVHLWQTALTVYKNKPFMGVGYGVERYRIGAFLRRYESMIHNDYLAVLLGTGLIGFILFILWQGQWCVELINVYKNSDLLLDKTIAIAVFAFFVTSLVVRLSDNIVQSTDKLYPLAALVAATLALPRIREEENAQNQEEFALQNSDQDKEMPLQAGCER